MKRSSIPRLEIQLIFVLILVGSIFWGKSLSGHLSQNLRYISAFKELQQSASDFIGLLKQDICSQAQKSDSADSPVFLPNPTNLYEAGCMSVAFSKLACAAGNAALAYEWIKVADQHCSRTEVTNEWGGRLAWSAHDWEEATRRWLQDDQSPRFIYERAFELWKAEETDASLYLFNTILPARESDLASFQLGFGYDILGNIYHEKGEINLSLAAREKAVQARPERVDFWVRLGAIYREVGRIEDSKIALQQAVLLLGSSNAQTQGWAYEQLAQTYAAAENYPEAIEAYQQALEWYQQSIHISVQLQAIKASIEQYQNLLTPNE